MDEHKLRDISTRLFIGGLCLFLALGAFATSLAYINPNHPDGDIRYSSGPFDSLEECDKFAKTFRNGSVGCLKKKDASEPIAPSGYTNEQQCFINAGKLVEREIEEDGKTKTKITPSIIKLMDEACPEWEERHGKKASRIKEIAESF